MAPSGFIKAAIVAGSLLQACSASAISFFAIDAPDGPYDSGITAGETMVATFDAPSAAGVSVYGEQFGDGAHGYGTNDVPDVCTVGAANCNAYAGTTQGTAPAGDASNFLATFPAFGIDDVALSSNKYDAGFDFDAPSPPPLLMSVPTSSAPEPTQWLLLVAGFGLVGAAFRLGPDERPGQRRHRLTKDAGGATPSMAHSCDRRMIADLTPGSGSRIASASSLLEEVG